MNLVKEFENFNWKGPGPLTVKSGLMKAGKGFKPSMVVQIRPASCVTAIALKTKWGLYVLSPLCCYEVLFIGDIKPNLNTQIHTLVSIVIFLLPFLLQIRDGS